MAMLWKTFKSLAFTQNLYKVFVKKVCFWLVVLLACFPGKVTAQICPGGSLGDAFINLDFANGYQMPPNLTTLKPNYDCPDSGQYILVAGPFYGCYHNGLFVIAGDHTRLITEGNGGQSMLVNARGVNDDIIRDTVTGLCSDITYTFSGYVSNVMKGDSMCGTIPIPPNLIFDVEDSRGNVIAADTTGNIQQNNELLWNEFGVTFSKPANGNDVVIKIKNNAKSGCGNVFLMDDITVKPCGSKVTASLDGSDSSFIDVCDGYTNPFMLTASYIGLSNPVMNWQNSLDQGTTWQDIPGATTLTYKIPKRDSGIILYRLLIANPADYNSPTCRIASNSIWTGVHFLPKHLVPENLRGCLDKDYAFPFTASVTTYNWTGPNGFTSIAPEPVIPAIQQKDTGLYKVTLITDFGCRDTDSLYLQVYPSATVEVTKEHDICQGAVVQFDASGGGSYLWTPPTGLTNDTIPNPELRPQDSTKYQIVIENSFGCRDSAMVAVNVFKYPTASAGPGKVIVGGDSVMLNATIGGTAVEYSWSPYMYMDNNLLQAPTVYPPSNTVYTLTANSTVGCGSATSTVTVKVYKDIFIPNAFTPNGDGDNDRFRILPYNDYKLVEMIIYNRWGSAVFKATNANDGWDGTVKGNPEPPGAYVYFIKLQAPDKQIILKKGTILLIR